MKYIFKESSVTWIIMDLRKGDKLIKKITSLSNRSLGKTLKLSKNIYFICVNIYSTLCYSHTTQYSPHPKKRPKNLAQE